MEFQDVNDIAVSDMKNKGVEECRILQCTLLAAGIWTLVYTCDTTNKFGSHFHVYLVDDKTGEIVSSVN